MIWSVTDDSSSHRVNPMEEALTKRGLLSMLSSVHDPLGFAGPLILKARLIVQALVREGVTWDEEIQEKYAEDGKNG